MAASRSLGLFQHLFETSYSHSANVLSTNQFCFPKERFLLLQGLQRAASFTGSTIILSGSVFFQRHRLCLFLFLTSIITEQYIKTLSVLGFYFSWEETKETDGIKVKTIILDWAGHCIIKSSKTLCACFTKGVHRQRGRYGESQKGTWLFYFYFSKLLSGRERNSVHSTKDEHFCYPCWRLIPACFELKCNPIQVFDHEFSTSSPL